MKRLFISILVGFAVIQQIQAQVLELGNCSENYLGRWYENQKYPFIFEFGGKCIYAEYGAMENGNISVYNFNIKKHNNKTSGVEGSARIVGDGKLRVKFDSMPSFIGESDYWILDTDYANYSVVYSCNNFARIVNTKVVWILTRQRHPRPAIVEHAKKVIQKNGISLKPLIMTNQTDCEA